MRAKFYLQHPQREFSAIVCVYNYRSVEYRKSIGISVKPKLWDKEKQKAKVTSSDRSGILVNNAIESWSKAIDRMIYQTNLRSINIRDKKHFWVLVDCELQNLPYVEHIGETQQITEYWKNIYIPRFNDKKSETRITKLRVCLAKLEEYENTVVGRKLTFSEIDHHFYREYASFVYGQKLTINYFGDLIKVLKQVMKEAYEVDRIHSSTDYQKFVCPKVPMDAEYLSVDELIRIDNVNIDEAFIDTFYPISTRRNKDKLIKTYDRVKKLFIIACFTGLRASDFTDLRDYNIKGDHLHKITKKCKEPVVIPINPCVRRILDEGFDISAPVCIQKFQSYIKHICKYAGLTEIKEIRTSAGGVLHVELRERWELISTHTCRRSFATNAVISGIPVSHIMMMTGHSTEREFWKYVKVKSHQIADVISKYPFFQELPENIPQTNPSSRQLYDAVPRYGTH